MKTPFTRNYENNLTRPDQEHLLRQYVEVTLCYYLLRACCEQRAPQTVTGLHRLAVACRIYAFRLAAGLPKPVLALDDDDEIRLQRAARKLLLLWEPTETPGQAAYRRTFQATLSDTVQRLQARVTPTPALTQAA